MDRSGRDGLGRRTATGRGGTALDRRGESMGHDGDGRGVPGRGHGADLPSGGCGPRAGRGAGLREDRPGADPGHDAVGGPDRHVALLGAAPARGQEPVRPPQQGSDLVEDLDGLVDGGRRHDGSELLPGLGRAGGAPGDVGQKMRHEGPQRGAREPVRDKGRAVLARAGPVSSSMRTTPTAYRSWAGSGSAPYLAPGDTWSGVPITWVTRASRGSASWQPGSRDKKTGRPREPGLRDGCRRAGVREDDVRRAARAQQDVGGLPSRWTSPAEWMTWRASSSWPMAGSTQACGNEP